MFRVVSKAARRSCVPGVTFIAGCLCMLVFLIPHRMPTSLDTQSKEDNPETVQALNTVLSLDRSKLKGSSKVERDRDDFGDSNRNQDRNANQEDRHANQEDRNANQEDRHANQEDRNANQEDRNANQEDRNANQEDRHANQEDRNANQEDRHVNQEDRNANQEDRHANQEDRHANQEDRNANKGHLQGRGRPPRPLPPLNHTLPRAEFSSNWVEDTRLSDLRKYGLVEKIPSNQALSKLTTAQLSVMLHSYLDNINIRCHRKLRMGLVGDNGWEVCDDMAWRPTAPCTIYSFGINYDFSFDDDAGRIYGCDVYSFDPSMTKQPTSRRSDRVMFYRLGVGGQSGQPIKTAEGWLLHSFSNFRRMLNHTDKIIDVVKMDVERSEWGALEAMLQERQLLNVRQLLVEFHVYARHHSALRNRLILLRGLEDIGFRKFYITKNGVAGCSRYVEGFPVQRTKCYEVHYVNVNFQRTED